MINDHLLQIRRVMERVPRKWWPSVFTGFTVREDQERIALAKYLQNILQAQVQADGSLDAMFDLSEETLIPNVDLPEECDVVTAGSAFLSSHCHFNEVDPIFDPIEALRIIGLDGNEREFITTLHAIDQYSAEVYVPLNCAVHPYIDCALITALLFAVRDRIRDGQMLKFVAADWADLPDNINGQTPYDLTYTSSAWQEGKYAHYGFRPIKTGVSKGKIFFNASAYALAEEPHSSRRASLGRSSLMGVNFNGDFDPDQNHHIMNVRNSQGQSVPVQLYGMRSDFDYEAKMIIALSNGLLREQAVVPSLQGYLWAVESGLLQTPDGTIGTLLTRDVDASKGIVGYGAKLQASKDGQAKWRAEALLTALMDLQELAIFRIQDRLVEDRENFARQILGVLKGPIVFTRKYDSGILSRIPAELAIKAAFPRGELFEKESTYQPPWWEAFDEVKMASVKISPRVNFHANKTKRLKNT